MKVTIAVLWAFTFSIASWSSRIGLVLVWAPLVVQGHVRGMARLRRYEKRRQR